MTKPTRAEKRKRVVHAFIHQAGDLPVPNPFKAIDAAILADYAPLSAERRAELEARKRYLSRKCEQYTQSDAVFYKEWLAEIDAELEGNDG